MLHTIGWLTEGVNLDPWLDKYIFPGGTIPSLSQISKSSEKLFIIEDLHNFGADYYKTVKAWQNNFEKNYEKLKQNNPKYDERFRRMWNYYLLSCAGGFSTRLNQLWQIVFSKKGVKGGYVSVR